MNQCACVAASVWVRGGTCPPAGSAGPVRSSTTSPSMWRAARSWASWATQVGTRSKERSNNWGGRFEGDAAGRSIVNGTVPRTMKFYFIYLHIDVVIGRSGRKQEIRLNVTGFVLFFCYYLFFCGGNLRIQSIWKIIKPLCWIMLKVRLFQVNTLGWVFCSMSPPCHLKKKTSQSHSKWFNSMWAWTRISFLKNKLINLKKQTTSLFESFLLIRKYIGTICVLGIERRRVWKTFFILFKLHIMKQISLVQGHYFLV